jgi:hypothetical protein
VCYRRFPVAVEKGPELAGFLFDRLVSETADPCSGDVLAQHIERLDNRSVATEKDASIVGLKRPQSTIGRAIRVAFWRPGEEAGIEAGTLQSGLEPPETLPPRR